MEGIEAGAGATVGCPHCGGHIKPAAKICKHCRGSLQIHQVQNPTPTATTAAMPVLPSVVLKLRSFLAAKKLVEPAKIEQLLRSRTADDAAELVRQFAVRGMITQIQAEALIGEFHQQQMSTARSVIDVARARGLIPATHTEHALLSYAPMAFTVSIQDHLVDSGLLTREQAGGISTGQAGRRRTKFAVASVILGIAVIAVVVVASKGNSQDFQPPNDWSDHGIGRDGSKYLAASFRLVDKDGKPTAADGRLFIALPRCISSIQVRAAEFMPYRKGLLWGRKHIEIGPGCQGGGSLASAKIIMRFVQDKTEKVLTVQNFGVSFERPPEDLPAAVAGSVLVSE